ncbi:MAG: branched-chain amino acid aminotransferase [Planctomycetota bacterium]
MRQIFANLLNDEAGFLVSAELVLVATIGVLSLVVGLSEVAFNINQELEDLGSAFGSINQSYQYNGVAGNKGKSSGSAYSDSRDAGDCDCDIVCGVSPTGEN